MDSTENRDRYKPSSRLPPSKNSTLRVGAGDNNQYNGRSINPELLMQTSISKQSFASRRQRPTAASFASRRSAPGGRSFVVSNQEGLMSNKSTGVSQNLIGMPPAGHTVLLSNQTRRRSSGGLVLGSRRNSNQLPTTKGNVNGNYIIDQALEEQMIQNRLDQAFLSPRPSTTPTNVNNQLAESLAIEHMAPADDVFNADEIDVSFHFSDMDLFQVWKKICTMVFITIEVGNQP